MNDVIEIGKRIREMREKAGLTQEELGASLGLNKSTIQRYESGKISRIKLPILEAIASELGINPEYLVLTTDDPTDYENAKDFLEAPLDVIDYFNGDAESVVRFQNAVADDAISENSAQVLSSLYDNIRPVHLKRFPLLGEIACGEPIFADEDKESYVMADMDIRADFCLRAKGDSMTGARINDGDVVFIRKMPIVDNGEIAAVIIEDEATLKRVYYDRQAGILQLIAENPKYKPLVYQGEELNQIRILGKAVYFMSAIE